MKRQKDGTLGASAGIFLLCAVSSIQVPAAFAGTFPGTGAPLTAVNRMAPEEGADPSNPFSYPILKDLARSLARNGFPASFFLGLDSKSGPGIDLRTILLYEAGVLKSPVKLFAPHKKKPAEAPTLSIGSFPDAAGKMPSAAPQLEPPGSIEAGPDSEGNSSEKSGGDTEQHPLTIDLRHFTAGDLQTPLKSSSKSKKKHKSEKSRHKGSSETAAKDNTDFAALAMLQPLSVQSPQLAPAGESSFRFWTVPQPLTLPDMSLLSQASYSGPFVMMSPAGLKSIAGRKFLLSGGHMLASADDKPIAVETPSATVTIESGCTAYVEVLQDGASRIRVLELKPGSKNVLVKFSSDGKNQKEESLSAGDDLIVADRPLTESEKSLHSAASPQSGTAGGITNSSKTQFSAKELLSSDTFFSVDLPQQNQEQRSAVMSLRERLK